MESIVHLRRPHAKQLEFMRSPATRRCVRAGRRSGKTSGMAIYAVEEFLKGERILYATPTADQLTRFWHEVCQALADPVAAGVFYKNETNHIIERLGTEQRIRGKTAWDSNSMRGDFCTRLILDEYSYMNESVWHVVAAPMMLDRAESVAVFCYTPASLHSRSISKADDPRHAAKLFKAAQADTTGRWAAFHFTSHDNPHISTSALADITKDMTQLAYEQEILAEDKDEAPGALWNHAQIDALRVTQHPSLVRIVIGVDPSGGGSATECGIVVVGKGTDGHGYVIADRSLHASPHLWATEVVKAYKDFKADRVVVETNFGGDMVENTLRNVEGGQRLSLRQVTSSRGKALRAEPIAALYERKMIHHHGPFPHLEEQMCNWSPGDPKSPDRLDSMVFAATELDIVVDTKTGYESLIKREATYAGRGAY